jgi:hypothetical protein
MPRTSASRIDGPERWAVLVTAASTGVVTVGEDHARGKRHFPSHRVVSPHELRGRAGRHFADAVAQALLELDLPRELGIRDAIRLEGLGLCIAEPARDILFNLFLVHNTLSRSRFEKPRSSRICLKRRRARLRAWLNAASLSSSSRQITSFSSSSR